MPLPEKSVPWPPIDPAVMSDMEDWAAWFSANPERLSYRYLNRHRDNARFGPPANRPSQYRGGLVGKVSRFFWGEPTPLGEKRAHLHMPLAKDIARTSADLLYSEPPVLKAANKETQKRLEALMDAGMKRTLIGAGETAAALGGAYLRVVWDDRVSDRPWISRVDADGAAPEFAYGDKLMAVTFWTVLAVDGQKVVRHLERHEPGAIMHGVYEGTDRILGKKIDLKAFPQTERLQPYRALPIGKKLAAEYIPNTMVAADWRDLPGAAGLGASDYQGSEGFLSSIDEIYTSLMRDIRLARSRIIVPQGYLLNNGPGSGATWEDREVYAQMNVPPTADQQITLNQFMIRYEEHLSSAGDLIQKVIRNAGYSGNTFGDDSAGPAVTATEIKARTARSMSTRGRKSEASAVGISGSAETILMLEASGMFPGIRGVEVERPEVVFQDSIQEDIKTLAETAALMKQAEAASVQTMVALLHPDWDQRDQKAEVTRILKESGRLVEDPVMLGADRPIFGSGEADDGDGQEHGSEGGTAGTEE